jgi:adenylate cyclase class IV
LRIQKNSQFAKLWLKTGKIHNDCREELEIRFNRDDFDNLEKLLLKLGYQVIVT